MHNKVLTSLDKPEYNKSVVVENNRCKATKVSILPRSHGVSTKVLNSSGFFSLFKRNPQGGLANGLWFRTHPKKRLRLLARQRVNLQTVSQEQSRWVILATDPRKVVLWKLKSDLMGAVVFKRWLKLDGYHPLVLPYCLNTIDSEQNSRHNVGIHTSRGQNG